ncbi:hypothetical protein [Salipiger sp. PrR003]|uniref:hypothetical protein n=1 Tax=Salipiger sp. PrR003 TaxID=2706776 RepID=UPI0013DB29CE|nr:hypothetical protein [Salipiger sp. PrR003]NDV50567.1 hypothetical protein [Salipiger sp. PrR003]
MTLPFDKDILPETVGLMLCKVVGDDDLRLAEPVMFDGGRPAVLKTLNRAHLAGHVGGSIDKSASYWADQLNSDWDTIGEIRLDRDSWNSLKNHWMRCKMQPSR